MSKTTPPPKPDNSMPDETTILGILGLVLAFTFPLAGVIVSVIGYRRAKKDGRPLALYVVGLAMNIGFLILGLIVGVAFFYTLTTIMSSPQ